ncbi:T9SS type A sorting domain-containing protein [Flavobacteriaceae bacterium 14752]|uniref:T9SS type A sorting domain-containing protein n=1 Tax=Mesohalobacter salilacus TaxID=2491711 RepID=UPI000F634645|nr:T9SS C-terminal target domain-containing protein [Flavobacteriaceae bacterium 14752]
MKTLINFITLLIVCCSYAQDPQLFQYNWRLESIVTDTDSFIPDSNPNPNTGTFNHIIFFDQNNGVPYYFQFGIYGSVFGDDLIFSGNQSFVISNVTLSLGESSQASLFLVDHFLFEDQLNDLLYNPYTYDFRYENGFIFLDITNSAGNVVTFFDNFLSQEEFLRQNVKIYPNPVVNDLFIESNQTNIQELLINDLSGRIVLKQDGLENNQLDVSKLRQGIYILKIKTSNGHINKKIVKK